MNCPRCGSPHITHNHAGEAAGGQLGALFGAAIGAASAMRGARVGAVLGSAFGPVGAAAGGVTGAVFTGIVTGSATSAIASAVGRLFDREVLRDRQCQSCGELFRISDAAVTSTAEPEREKPVGPEPGFAAAGQDITHLSAGGA